MPVSPESYQATNKWMSTERNSLIEGNYSIRSLLSCNLEVSEIPTQPAEHREVRPLQGLQTSSAYEVHTHSPRLQGTLMSLSAILNEMAHDNGSSSSSVSVSSARVYKQHTVISPTANNVDWGCSARDTEEDNWTREEESNRELEKTEKWFTPLNKHYYSDQNKDDNDGLGM